MINLIPSEMKTQLEFSKRNATVLRYIRKVGTGFAISLGIFLIASLTIRARVAESHKSLEEIQSETKSLESVEQPARVVQTRLNLIAQLEKDQAKFSTLLSDIAKYMPKGAALSSISLTGEAAKPVRIQITANSYDSAAAFRDALVTSPRIGGADIETVSSASPGSFTASVLVGFKPGAAK